MSVHRMAPGTGVARRSERILGGLLAAFAILSQAYLTLLPGLMRGLAVRLGVEVDAIGYLAGLEFGATALVGLAVVAAPRWFVSDRRLATTGLIVLALGNAGSAFTDRILLFAVCRTVAGIGAGLLSLAWSRAAARQTRPGVIFAGANAASMAFGAIGFVLLSTRSGPAIGVAILGALAIAALALAVAARIVPDAPIGPEHPASPRMAEGGSSRMWAVAASCFLHFLGNASLWAFMAVIGTAAGLPFSAVQRALALSMIGGVAGALAAMAWSARRRPFPGLRWAILLILAATVPLLHIGGVATFAVSAFLVNAAVLAATAFYMAYLAEIGGAHGAVLGVLAIKLGIAGGPPLGGLLIAGDPRGHLLVPIAAGMFIGAFALIQYQASHADNRATYKG